MYYSLCGQDEWVLEMLNSKTNGFFIDLGAGDGITYNNTYALETQYGWNGICVENTSSHFQNLDSNRSCSKYQTTINKADGQCYIDENGKIVETGTTLVDCISFDTLMSMNGHTETIDYLSINVGNSQRQIIESIDLDRYDITLISIQNNIYRSNFIGSDDDIFLLMREYGYERKRFNVQCSDPNHPKYPQPIEDFYYKISSF